MLELHLKEYLKVEQYYSYLMNIVDDNFQLYYASKNKVRFRIIKWPKFSKVVITLIRQVISLNLFGLSLVSSSPNGDGVIHRLYRTLRMGKIWVRLVTNALICSFVSYWFKIDISNLLYSQRMMLRKLFLNNYHIDQDHHVI